MSTSRMPLIVLFAVLVTALAVPAAGQACSVTATWTSTTFTSIRDALNSAYLPFLGGDVYVSGVCTEPEVFINERFFGLRLFGVEGTQATLQGTSGPLGNAITIRGGRSITVRGFKITPAGAMYGVQVTRGGTAVIDSCVIEGFTGGAIVVNQEGFARIVNSTLQNNGYEGIFVGESSAVRVGFLSTDDPAPQPNTIRNNGLDGILVTRTSNARITRNVITGNGADGIDVENNSHADIAWNDLSGNHGAGIRVRLNSSARLGIGSGLADWNVPNSTTTKNLGAGLECTLGGAVEGTLGTLSGEHGRHKFGHGCVHDLTR